MSDKQIKDSYENSSKRMSGAEATIASKINDSNDPNMHDDLHEKMKMGYDKIEKSPESREDVKKGKRENVEKGDQSKEGSLINIIFDPAMREMYQVVHNSTMTNVFDRFSQQQPIQCKFCIE